MSKFDLSPSWLSLFLRKSESFLLTCELDQFESKQERNKKHEEKKLTLKFFHTQGARTSSSSDDGASNQSEEIKVNKFLSANSLYSIARRFFFEKFFWRSPHSRQKLALKFEGFCNIKHCTYCDEFLPFLPMDLWVWFGKPDSNKKKHKKSIKSGKKKCLQTFWTKS